MDSINVTRSDFFDQYFDWWRRFFSDASAGAINRLAQSPDVSWRDALLFVNDYLLLPLVLVVGLFLLLKQTLSD